MLSHESHIQTMESVIISALLLLVSLLFTPDGLRFPGLAIPFDDEAGDPLGHWAIVNKLSPLLNIGNRY